MHDCKKKRSAMTHFYNVIRSKSKQAVQHMIETSISLFALIRIKLKISTIFFAGDAQLV